MNSVRHNRNAMMLGISTLASSGLLVCVLPFLARSYSPAEFGEYGSYGAVLAIIATVVTLRFEAGIPIARAGQTAATLLSVGCCMTLLSALLWPSLIALGTHSVPSTAGSILRIPLLALSAGIAVQGMLQLGTHVAIRYGKFPRIAYARVAQSGSQVFVQLLSPIAFLGWGGLIFGDLVGRGAGAIVVWWRSELRPGTDAPAELVSAAKDYSYLPLQMAPAALLTMVASQMPLLAIPLIFGNDVAGKYFLAYRVTYMPAVLLASGVAPVLLGELGRLSGARLPVREVMRSAAFRLASLVLPLYAVGALVGPPLLERILGDTWHETGSMVRVLAPAAALWAIASPLSSIMLAKARGTEAVVFSVADILVKGTCIVLGSWSNSFPATLYMLSGSGVVLAAISIRRFMAAAKSQSESLVTAAVPAEASI